MPTGGGEAENVMPCAQIAVLKEEQSSAMAILPYYGTSLYDATQTLDVWW
jgi:hypothetical protein